MTEKEKKEYKEYNEFLEMKKTQRIESGFAVEDADLNPALFDFQKYCVKRALAVGKFALFEDCGLGKTIQQLEWAQKVFEHTDQPVLILAPLAVISQTIKEGAKFGYKVVDYDEMLPNNIDECGIFITNYDNLPNIVVMRGFGTFFTKVKAQKVGKDFKNGGSIVIPEHKVVLFKASKDFKLKNITI